MLGAVGGMASCVIGGTFVALEALPALLVATTKNWLGPLMLSGTSIENAVAVPAICCEPTGASLASNFPFLFASRYTVSVVSAGAVPAIFAVFAFVTTAAAGAVITGAGGAFAPPTT